MRYFKAFGNKISSRGPDSEAAKVHIGAALMNRFNALCTAKTVHMA